MRDKITKAVKDAMREKDEIRLCTLRLMLAAMKDREIANRSKEGPSEITDAEAFALFDKMVRQREESGATYEEAGRMELAERERAEIAVIKEFLPKPLTSPEIKAAVEAAIADTGASSIRDMGKVMGHLKSLHAGRMDFGAAGAQVKAALD